MLGLFAATRREFASVFLLALAVLFNFFEVVNLELQNTSSISTKKGQHHIVYMQKYQFQKSCLY